MVAWVSWQHKNTVCLYGLRVEGRNSLTGLLCMSLNARKRSNPIVKVNLIRQNSPSIIFLLIVLTLFACNNTQATDVKVEPNAQVFFSPRGGCTEAIVSEIAKAKTEILVQAFSFTSKPIAEALHKAKKAGIQVEIILDKSNRTAKYSSGDFTAHMDIPTYIDAKHAIAHNKIMIMDKQTVITGSFNFTKAAEESNAENVLILQSKELAKAYIDNWNKHKEHSEKYEGR